MSFQPDFDAREADWRHEVTKGPARVAVLFLFVIAIGFAAVLYWAYTASLEEVVSGAGKVVPSQQNQVVQHLEGGIVSELLVQEGDLVETGDVLMRIKDTSFSSELREIDAQKLCCRTRSRWPTTTTRCRSFRSRSRDWTSRGRTSFWWPGRRVRLR